MSHEFLIQRNDNSNEQGYFQGYAEGIFYSAFNCQKFNRGVSGSNEQETFTTAETKSALEKVLNSSEIANYPDPDRISSIKDFYSNIVLNAKKKDVFTVRFF